MWFKKKDVVLFISYTACDSNGCEVKGSRMVRLKSDHDLINFHSRLPTIISDTSDFKLRDIIIESITRLQ